MKYPASKHYAHLSIHDPIPEIELRYNEPMRAGYESFARHAWWAITAIFVSQLVLAILFQRAIMGSMLSIVFALGIFFYMLSVVDTTKLSAGKSDPGDPWGVPLRDQIRYWFFYAIVMWSVMAGFRMFSDGIIEGVFTLAWYTLMFGVGLAVCGRFARQPGQISCMKCDYPLVGLQLPCPCPECGTTLACLSHATDRPRARDTRLVLVGIAIVVLSLGTMVLRFYRPQALYTAMPRAALLQLAPIDRSAFESLMGTAMTPEEEDLLIAGMFKSRTGFTSGSSYEQGEWFGNMINQGRLSTDQLTELFDEYVQVEISAPKRVRVGAPVQLTLRADYAHASLDVWYFFSGFQIDEDPTLLGRMDRALSRTFIVNGPKQVNIDRGYVPVYSWTPEAPGTHTIRARIIFALGSGYSLSKAVVWTDEDLPEYPNPPIWSRVVEIERTITIEE